MPSARDIYLPMDVCLRGGRMYIFLTLCFQGLFYLLNAEKTTSLTIYNNADFPIVIYWVNPNDIRDVMPISDALPVGHNGIVSSVEGHKFVFGAPDRQTAFFTKSRADEVISVRYNEINVLGLFHRLESPPTVINVLSESSELLIKNSASAWIEMHVVGDDNLIDSQPSLSIAPHSEWTLEGSATKTTYVFVLSTDGIQRGIEFVKGPTDETLTLWKRTAAQEGMLLSSTDDNITEDSPEIAGRFSGEHSLRAIAHSSDQSLYDHVKGAVESCLFSYEPPLSDSELNDCLSLSIFDMMNDEIRIQTEISKTKEALAAKLRRYTCGDPNIVTSPAITSILEYVHDRSVQVNTLLQNSHAQIWTIDDFVSPQECAALQAQTKARLQQAVTMGGVLSHSRRAQQAGYAMKGETDPAWQLYQRILNFTNAHADYGLRVEGQEHLTVIQYNKGDEYMSHCDGICDGSRYINKGRVATAVLYCQTAAVGGGTSFPRSDVFVKPKPGQATIFTYKGSDDVMDEGLTEHSGCPVEEGEKWIATAWLRQGVSSDDSAYLYDGLGRKKPPREEIHNKT